MGSGVMTQQRRHRNHPGGGFQSPSGVHVSYTSTLESVSRGVSRLCALHRHPGVGFQRGKQALGIAQAPWNPFPEGLAGPGDCTIPLWLEYIRGLWFLLRQSTLRAQTCYHQGPEAT